MASWILTPPGELADDDRAALAQITARCEELNATRDLVREFADMLCHRRGERLEAWASQAEASPVSELRGFAKGLRKDWAAVTAGLTVPYSSGAVEGHVNRIILWNQICQVRRWLGLADVDDRQDGGAGWDVDCAGRRPGRRGDVGEPVQQLVEGGAAVVDGGAVRRR